MASSVTGLEGPRRDAEELARRPSLVWGFSAYAVTVLILVTVTFALPRALPGDPLAALIDPSTPVYVDQESLRAELSEYYRLDRPYLDQYGAYLAGLVRGDLGVSIRHNRPVAEVILDRLPWTVLLIFTGMLIAVVVGLVSGTHSGWRRGRPVDRGLLGLALTLHSFPAFFLASLAAFFLGAKLGWFPLAGARTQFSQLGLLASVVDVAHHLVLPAIVVAAGFAASQFLVMRAGIVSELGSDYLLLGRAKGLGERRLKYRYAARNALLPVVTLIGMHVGFAVTSSIYVESVFAYPGLGRLMFEAVTFRDYPILQASFLVLSLVVVTANFLADLAYRRLDPRVAA